ncbi:MAG TPA: hypothetical protein VF881_02380 [Polyangiaceae bacterium]
MALEYPSGVLRLFGSVKYRVVRRTAMTARLRVHDEILGRFPGHVVLVIHARDLDFEGSAVELGRKFLVRRTSMPCLYPGLGPSRKKSLSPMGSS